jgi:hypothetical protein
MPPIFHPPRSSGTISTQAQKSFNSDTKHKTAATMMNCHISCLLVLVALFAITVADDDYNKLLNCLIHGSDSQTACQAIENCVWCPASSKLCCSKEGLCVSSHASESFDPSSHYQCSASSDDDTAPPAADDDTPAPDKDDDYFPDNDDGTC